MTSDILFEEIADSKQKKIGRIILNRPHALNAISHDMFRLLEKQLLQWQEDDAVKAVLIKSNSEKAFCAGGDIRAVYENREQPLDQKVKYFSLEYGINPLIYHYTKPYISFLDGITMGGGAGISIHGSHPIGTERLKFAMPETSIGFFPDVGMSYYFGRMPYCVGLFLGLTGSIIGANDARNFGLIKHHVLSDHLNTLEKKLIETPFLSSDHDVVSDIIAEFQSPLDTGKIQLHQDDIAKHFQFDKVEEIISSLESGDHWAQEIAHTLLQRSPVSLKVSLRQLHEAEIKNFDEVMRTDRCLVRKFLQSHDFIEGIRAAVIDKDKQPCWQPAQLDGVDNELVDLYFNATATI